jgi:tRNA-Thr(GGU) m(6)t(6)A37 methyltransferase TsaA
MLTIRYNPIGIIHSPLKDAPGAPIQSAVATHVKGTIEIYRKYLPGLRDIAGFSHLILLYHFHLCQRASLTVKPYLDNQEHGIFATRAPVRPNPIGLSVVRLLRVNGRTLSVQDVDVLDGTPLLDIKPYIPRFDSRKVERIGWVQGNIQALNRTRSDSRFTKRPVARSASSE